MEQEKNSLEKNTTPASNEETNTQPTPPPGSPEPENDEQVADSKNPDQPGNKDGHSADDIVQGKKLEEEQRGGDATDAEDMKQ
ncbi:MAG: hypothetical protein ABIN94_02645 [Ferruginibacter sp.]